MRIGQARSVDTGRQPTLGVHLLETITRGMYSEPLHSIREYVQNGYDSIRKARREGLISAQQGTILVSIDERLRSLRIRDDGTGLSPEEAAVHLLDIGASDKARSDTESAGNAGFRGIGRMAGISYCKTLRFETSCGDGRKCIVEFDAAGINRLTKPGQEPATIVDAINRNTKIDEAPTNDCSRYVEVTLEGLDSDSPFLKQNIVGRYLELNAPVAHDPSVWSYAGDVEALAAAANGPSSLEKVRILICDSEGNVQADIRRPFKDTFRTADARGKNPRNVKVSGVRALPLNGMSGDGWWGWVAEHERRGALADVSFGGLRIRMHNIAIGDDAIVRNLFTTQNHARWCFGEIHVTDLSLMPNAQRDNFEDSRAWDRLKTQLQEQANLLDKEIRRESQQRNMTLTTLTRRAKNQIEKAKDAIAEGFISYDAKVATIQALEKESKKLETQSKQKKRTDAEKSALNVLRERLEQVAKDVRAVRKTGTDDALAHLNKQARNAVRAVFRVLKKELNEKQFSAVQEKIHAALKPGRKKA